MSIAANLRRAVDENGVSAASLAREIDAEPSTVRRYLNGTARPNDAVLARLAAALHTTPEDIRFGRATRRIGKITTDEVSRITGIDPLSLRVGLQRGIWPFGTAYKRAGSSRYVYEYDPEEVIRYANAVRVMRGEANEERHHTDTVARIAD